MNFGCRIFLCRNNSYINHRTLSNKHSVFSYKTPGTEEGELFIITRILSGKTMDKAGLKLNDRILV
jgi:hypothetical protein